MKPEDFKAVWEDEPIERHHDRDQPDGVQPHEHGHFKREPYPLIWQCLSLEHIGLEAAKECAEPEAHGREADRE